MNQLLAAGVTDLVVITGHRATPSASCRPNSPVACRHLCGWPGWTTSGKRSPGWTSSSPVLAPAAPVLSAADLSPATRVVVDLALPHDVEPDVAGCPGGTHQSRCSCVAAGHHSAAEAAAGLPVDQETDAFVAAQAAASVEPVVVSLRARADGILEDEVKRLRLSAEPRRRGAAEVEKALRRAMSALLHAPTVRMKRFASDPGGERFAAALQALFDLDPATVQVLSTPPEVPGVGGADE